MPHTKSAKKSLRKDEKRRDRNRLVKKALRTQIKKFLSAVSEGTPEQQQVEYQACSKKLDKAAARRVIHPNAASRKKSRLSAMMTAKK